MKRVIVGIAVAGGLTLASVGGASAHDEEPLPKRFQNCQNVIDRQFANGQTGDKTGNAKDPKQIFEPVTNCDGYWIFLEAIGPNKS